MNGYVAQRRGRFYAVIYEGLDPVTGKEVRRWHPAGTDRAEAERLAAKLAAKETTRIDAVRSLTFGAYLTNQWLPAKKLHLATSTYRGYERNVQLHILPALGRVSIRRIRCQQIEALYDTLLHPAEGRGLSPKTVYSVHLIIRSALADAQRRGLVTRNVALVARAPRQRSLQRIEGISLTETELRQFLRTAAGHRFFPIYWLTAMTGMRRNEVLGLKWPDIDVDKKRLHLNRGLVAVGYEVHQEVGERDGQLVEITDPFDGRVPTGNPAVDRPWAWNPQPGTPLATGWGIGSGSRGASTGSHRCSFSTCRT